MLRWVCQKMSQEIHSRSLLFRFFTCLLYYFLRNGYRFTNSGCTVEALREQHFLAEFVSQPIFSRFWGRCSTVLLWSLVILMADGYSVSSGSLPQRTYRDIMLFYVPEFQVHGCRTIECVSRFKHSKWQIIKG